MSTYDILKANSLKMFMLLPPATSVIDFQQTKIMLLTYANFIVMMNTRRLLAG